MARSNLRAICFLKFRNNFKATFWTTLVTGDFQWFLRNFSHKFMISIKTNTRNFSKKYQLFFLIAKNIYSQRNRNISIIVEWYNNNMLFFAKFSIPQCTCINDGAALSLVALQKKKQKMNWVLQLAFVQLYSCSLLWCHWFYLPLFLWLLLYSYCNLIRFNHAGIVKFQMFMHIDCGYFDIGCQKTDFLSEVFSFEFWIRRPHLTQFIYNYFKQGGRGLL